MNKFHTWHGRVDRAPISRGSKHIRNLRSKIHWRISTALTGWAVGLDLAFMMLQNKEHHGAYSLQFHDEHDIIQLGVSLFIWLVASFYVSRILSKMEDSNQELRTINHRVSVINSLNDTLHAITNEADAIHAIENACWLLFEDDDSVEVIFDSETPIFQKCANLTKELWFLDAPSTSSDSLKHPLLPISLDDQKSFLPIIVFEECLWVIIFTETENTIRERSALLTNLASQISGSLTNIRYKSHLKEQTLIDPLTNLYNRRYLDAILEKEFNYAQRTHGTFSIIMIDIDHFKNVNDTYGHQNGDRVLQTLSDILRSGFPWKRDYICRFGWEEFLILLPDCPFSEGMKRAEELRSKVESVHFPLTSGNIKLTCSVGVSTLHPWDTDVQNVIARADTSLYTAKNQWRNRVEGTECLEVQLEEGEQRLQKY